jgi:ATP-dependent Lhr-like helicase
MPAPSAPSTRELRPAQVEPVLRLLESQGALVHGELRPSGTAPEWCDGAVCNACAAAPRARDAVAPLDRAPLGRFLPAWHGIGEDFKGPDRALEVVSQLAGLSLP